MSAGPLDNPLPPKAGWSSDIVSPELQGDSPPPSQGWSRDVMSRDHQTEPPALPGTPGTPAHKLDQPQAGHGPSGTSQTEGHRVMLPPLQVRFRSFSPLYSQGPT